MSELIFLIVLSGYFIQSIIFIIGAGMKFPKIKSDEEFPSVSVIVAARNEEDKILRCLKSLDELEYETDKLEIIIVDDQSTDNTGKIVDEFIPGKDKFKKIVTVKHPKLRGKTNALAHAIKEAKGEIILTTDADCEVNPNWVRATASYYRDNIGMVNGYTTQLADSPFNGMQAIDFIYLLLVASGTINIGLPVSCIGNNMSFRKKAYEETGGYENLPFSVTEDFTLLMAIYKLKKYKIIFPLEEKSLVTSLPCKTYKSLFRQKKRWAIGGLGVPVRGFMIMFWGYLTNLGILLTPFFFSATWFYLIFFKLMIDLMVLYLVHSRLGIKKNLKYFFIHQIYYIVYVFLLPFIVLSNRKVIWKGREF